MNQEIEQKAKEVFDKLENSDMFLPLNVISSEEYIEKYLPKLSKYKKQDLIV